MNNIKLLRFKEFEKQFIFALMRDMSILDRVEKSSWNSDTIKKSKKIRKNMLNASRTVSNEDDIILFDYTFYLMNFMRNRPKLFDMMFDFVKSNKHNYISIHGLEELVSEI